MNENQILENRKNIEMLITRLDIIESRVNDSRKFVENEVALRVREKFEQAESKILTIQKSLDILEHREERVKSLEYFKEEAEEKLLQNKMSTKSLENTINTAIYKYDVLIKDNLIVPGLLGDYGKFRNLGVFIEVNL